MPEIKLPTEPETPTRPAIVQGLKHKAPPKPTRRTSVIPPALVVSGTASRIPPAPRPQKRAESLRPPTSPQSAALDGAAGERHTERPVALASRQPAPKSGGLTALLGVSVTALVLGGSWFLREAPPTAQASPTTAAARDDGARRERAPVATPASEAATAVRSIDLDVSPSQPTTSTHRAPADGAATQQSVAAARPAMPSAAPGTTPYAAEPPRTLENTATEAPLAATDVQPAVTGASLAANPLTEGAVPTPAALPAFDANAAKGALGASALAASSCRKGDDPRGTAEVIVTFAPSGRVTSANVNGAPYGGTATGGCIASTLRGASVPPFSGKHVTVRKLVTIR